MISAMLLALAFVLGFGLRRGQICAVLAVREAMERRRWDRFWSFIACAAWASAVTLPLVWATGPMTALAPEIAITPYVLIGGALFGIGASVNGACAFGTLSRIVSGNTGFLFVLPGMALGAYTLQHLPVDWRPAVQGANALSFPTPEAIAAFSLALGVVGYEIARMRRVWVSTDAFVRRLVWRFWTPASAMAVIGLSGGALYAFGPDWSYGDAINEIVATASIGRAVALDHNLAALVCATLAGGVLAAALRREFALSWPKPSQIGASILGGALMAVGGGMIPGGNDGLVLFSLPGFLMNGVAAYVAMNSAIAIMLWLRTRFAGPMEAPYPAEE